MSAPPIGSAAGRGEVGIEQARLDAGTGLDSDLGAQRLELLHRIQLRRVDSLGNGNLHRSTI